MKLLRRLHRLFRGNTGSVKEQTFSRQTRAFHSARMLVAVWQATLVFWMCSAIATWPTLMTKRDLILLWPVSWVRFVGEPLGWKLVFGLFLIGTLIGLAFPHVRAARILSFLAVFQNAALANSTGKIYHDKHILVLVSFVLIFLPDLPRAMKSQPSRAFRHRYLTVFWTSQALIGLLYTMSGFGKAYYGFYLPLAKDQIGAFQLNALNLHIADNMIRRGVDTVLGAWMIDHPYLAWVSMLVMVYIQLLAIFAMCRPALHRWWGFGLLFFHLGTGLFMAILTTSHALALAIFIIGSPFALPGEWSLRESLAALPIFGYPFRRLFPGKPIKSNVIAASDSPQYARVQSTRQSV